MLGKFKIYIALAFLVIYVLSTAGCAVGWFLAGAGAAATAMTVTEDNKKEKVK
jgi:hypothetical protein